MNINNNLRVLQINLNTSFIATESALQVALELKIDILAIQEPWVPYTPSSNFANTRSINYLGFMQILPNYSNLCPRTLVYYASNIAASISKA